MKTGTKITIAALAGFAAGCACVWLAKDLEFSQEFTKGDISRFRSEAVNPGIAQLEEKMKKDPEEFRRTVESVTMLSSRIVEFDELVNLASAAIALVPQMDIYRSSFDNIRTLAANARANGSLALEAVEAVANGTATDIDYESAVSNLSLAYMMVDRRTDVAKRFVVGVDDFLRNRNVEDYQTLALARDLWADFCIGSALLGEDSEELKFWKGSANLLDSDFAFVFSDGRSAAGLEQYDFSSLKDCFATDCAIGLVQDPSSLEKYGIRSEPFKYARTYSSFGDGSDKFTGNPPFELAMNVLGLSHPL